MEESIEKLTINSEDEAFTLLKKALSNEISETTQIVFEGWPVFNLTIQGKDFNSSIPTRIMPPILELQKEIHRIYCRTKYGTENTNKLTAEERELLELIVTIKPGSTEFIANLFKALNEIVKNSNMSGTQVLILLIFIGTLISSNLAWKDWLSAKEREHGLEITSKYSHQETERIKLFTEAITKMPELRNDREAISSFKSALSNKLEPTDQLKINNEPVINGARAAEIVPPPKEISKEIRLDGKYSVIQVKFPQKYGGDYRFSVTRLSDDRTFWVDVSPDILTAEQISILKEGSFGIKHLKFTINAKEYKGHISNARMVSIEWPSEESTK